MGRIGLIVANLSQSAWSPKYSGHHTGSPAIWVPALYRNRLHYLFIVQFFNNYYMNWFCFFHVPEVIFFTWNYLLGHLSEIFIYQLSLGKAVYTQLKENQIVWPLIFKTAAGTIWIVLMKMATRKPAVDDRVKVDSPPLCLKWKRNLAEEVS